MLIQPRPGLAQRITTLFYSEQQLDIHHNSFYFPSMRTQLDIMYSVSVMSYINARYAHL